MRNAREEREKGNAACRILQPPVCAKLKLLWQPESGPIPVAMVERDRFYDVAYEAAKMRLPSQDGGLQLLLEFKCKCVCVYCRPAGFVSSLSQFVTSKYVVSCKISENICWFLVQKDIFITFVYNSIKSPSYLSL